MSEQERHEVSLSHEERPIERRPAACVSAVDIGAMLQKRLNDGQVSPPRASRELAGVHDGLNKRRPAVFVLAVYIGTAGLLYLEIDPTDSDDELPVVGNRSVFRVGVPTSVWTIIRLESSEIRYVPTNGEIRLANVRPGHL